MTRKADGSVYDKTYQYYLELLQSRPFEGREAVIGVARDGEDVIVPFFGQPIRWRGEGLVDETGRRPDFADCVVVCRYLLMAPAFEPKAADWVAFRDFPDAGPLTVFWTDAVEAPLARAFSGRLDRLDKACRAVGGGQPAMAITCDLCRIFTPLPKVPMLLVFNDADEDFSAAASLLFEKRAAAYLDAESQAILGHALTQRLLADVSL